MNREVQAILDQVQSRIDADALWLRTQRSDDPVLLEAFNRMGDMVAALAEVVGILDRTT